MAKKKTNAPLKGPDSPLLDPTIGEGGSRDAQGPAASDVPTKAEELGTLLTELDNLALGIEKDDDLNYLPPEGTTHPDHDNVTYLSGPDFLTQLGQLCKREFDEDLATRGEWDRQKSRELALFTGRMPEKTEPWEGASNVCLPFITVGTIQFQARSYEALLGGKEIVKTFFVGEQEARAGRVAKYMNYDLLYKVPNFEEGMDKSLFQLPIMGCIFRKTYFDPIIDGNRTDYVSAADLVVDYNLDYIENAQRISQILNFSINDIRVRVAAGLYLDKANKYEKSSWSPAQDLREAADEVMGQEHGQRSNSRHIIEQHRFVDLDSDGIAEPYVVTFDGETGDVLRITLRTYRDAEGKEHIIDYYTKYDFLPNPEGFYGIGYGTLLFNLNETANTIINEIIDAGSLANQQGGFVSKRSGLKKGALTFKMGEYKEFDGYVDDIRKAIFTFDFKGPDQTLFATLGLLYEYSKMVSSVSETSTGQLPASDTPASTVLALIEEGRKVYSAIHKRTHRSFKKELSKLYRLNSIFLKDNTYFQALNASQLPEGPQIGISASDFTLDIGVVPVSDPSITSRSEKIIKSQEVIKGVMTNPLSTNDPQAIYYAWYKHYEALEVDNIDIVCPEPQPPPPPPDLPAAEENAMFLREQEGAVALPQQDHDIHIALHSELATGPFSVSLTPIGKQLLEHHMQEHVAFQYLASKGQLDAGPQ
jgi:chaperonin GroES